MVRLVQLVYFSRPSAKFDVGKVLELQYMKGFDYTDAGRLLGHITLGARLLREKAATLEGFPPKLLDHLEHMILSHHGELEWGSPRRPKTLEALALHAIDNMDAKMMIAIDAMDKPDGEGDWTGYSRIFGRNLFRTPLAGPDFGEGEPA